MSLQSFQCGDEKHMFLGISTFSIRIGQHVRDVAFLADQEILIPKQAFYHLK